MTLPQTVSEFNAISDKDSRLAIEIALQLRPINEVLQTRSFRSFNDYWIGQRVDAGVSGDVHSNGFTDEEVNSFFENDPQ